MHIEHYENDQLKSSYNIFNEDNLEAQANRLVKQLCLHPSVKGQMFGNSRNYLRVTIDDRKNTRFELYK